MKKNKVGFDAKRAFHNRTGLGNYSRDTIRILSNFYPNNDYFLYNPKPAKITNFYTGNNVKEIFPKSKFWKKFSSIWRQKAIVKQLIDDKIEIYHGLSGEIPRGIEKTNIKTIVTIHDLIFIRYPKLYSFFDRKIHFNKFKFAAKNADVVVAISEQTKKDIITFLKINPNKIKVIYQGCADAFKKKYSQDLINKTKKKFQLPEKYILNVGTIEERKNLFNLVKAIKDIDTKLVVVGRDTSKYAQQVKQFIADNNLKDKVQFLKNVGLNELAIIYQEAQLFVYPSIFEGFGIPIIEALYSKTPVITSKDGCFKEAGGENSIYINPLDVSDIKDAIQKVLSDDELQIKMKRKGFQYVQRFNDENIATNFVKLYTNLLND